MTPQQALWTAAAIALGSIVAQLVLDQLRERNK